MEEKTLLLLHQQQQMNAKRYYSFTNKRDENNFTKKDVDGNKTNYGGILAVEVKRLAGTKVERRSGGIIS
ncbi:hypothetical protein C5167_005479 [Papaver somniferum]|uniref:Uncharacterized protein n=1 Tax=Papaver somniferum TaxID=3469 RepID=A0A4Y7JEF7_PAPSO|nr:hypothetical protein C5167_005479 [Papaver somniferum]